MRLPHHDYVTQAQIEPRCVWLLAVYAVHYNLDFGFCVRYLGGEYTAKRGDIESIDRAMKILVSSTILERMHRILDNGCPAEFIAEDLEKK